jgi:hypothetical protein
VRKSKLVQRSSLLCAMLMLIAFLYSLGLLSPAQASASNPQCHKADLVRTFYSDAQHTTVVGGWSFGCNCMTSSWGETTIFKTEVSSPCS